MIDFSRLAREIEEAERWRVANPGPIIWVTSIRGGQLFQSFTEAQPDNLPIRPRAYVYVGREHRRPGQLYRAASPLANPYPLRSEAARGTTLQNYAAWLSARFHPGTPQWDALLEILRASLGPRGVALGCWCAPLPCHGDVIRAAVLQMYTAGWGAPGCLPPAS